MPTTKAKKMKDPILREARALRAKEDEGRLLLLEAMLVLRHDLRVTAREVLARRGVPLTPESETAAVREVHAVVRRHIKTCPGCEKCSID